jgi:hypothetical protein
MEPVTRRDALKSFAVVMGAAALSEAAWAQAVAVRTQAAAAPATGLKFFTAAQHRTVDVLSELIIPADERSGGASAAKVADFIDLLLTGTSDVEQSAWRDGLAALDAMAKQRNGRSFAESTPEQQTAILTEISRNETNPQTPLEGLFTYAKERTIQGYYTSEIGIHKELTYKGQKFQKEFVGCDHPEHMA